jgi:hypothetical protein
MKISEEAAPSLTLVRRAVLLIIPLYFLLLYAFLLTRQWNDILPVNLTAISPNKLWMIMPVSFLAAALFLLCTRRPLSSALLFLLVCLVPYVAYPDFYKLRNDIRPKHEGDAISFENNEFMPHVAEMRKIKRDSVNARELWRELSRRYIDEAHADEPSKLAVARKAMLIVSNLFDYGNRGEEHFTKAGCVGLSEETGFKNAPIDFFPVQEFRYRLLQ